MSFWKDLAAFIEARLPDPAVKAQVADNVSAAANAKDAIDFAKARDAAGLNRMLPPTAATAQLLIDGFDISDIEKDLGDDLLDDEGFRSAVYQDSLGYWTIGIGRLVDKRKGGGITEAEARYLLRNDIANAVRDLLDEPWFVAVMHDKVRVRALINMMFQMGDATMNQFEKGSFELLRQHKFKECAAQLRKSRWYQQTTKRAERVIRMIETGEDRT